MRSTIFFGYFLNYSRHVKLVFHKIGLQWLNKLPGKFVQEKDNGSITILAIMHNAMLKNY